MSLNNANFVSIIKRQFLYKWKAYASLFSSMVMIQFISILFSLGGTGSMGFGSIGYNHIDIQFYSADIVIVFTMIWGFISAIMLTNKNFKEADFFFITNRLTSNLTNILFLLTASVIGAVTAILSGFLIKVIIILFFDIEFVGTGIAMGIDDMLRGVITTVMYIFMFSAFGYIIGTLTQLNKMFIVIIPAVIIGALFYIGSQESEILLHIGRFYFSEANFFILFIKTLITSGLCYFVATMISNRQEVRT